MSPGVLVVGTDTEVGKTVLCGALVAGLRARGMDAGYLKPLGSEGSQIDGQLINPDALWVARATGLDEPLPQLNPICLRQPLAPLAASRVEGVELSWREIIESTRAAMNRRAFYVVEGVGGLLVPICPGRSFLDLAVELGLPVLVAARPGLGTINHTLLTIDKISRHGLEVLGFCFSGLEPELSPPTARNSALITEYSNAPFLGALPWLDDLKGDDLGRRLAAAAEAGLDLELIAALTKA